MGLAGANRFPRKGEHAVSMIVTKTGSKSWAAVARADVVGGVAAISTSMRVLPFVTTAGSRLSPALTLTWAINVQVISSDFISDNIQTGK